MFRRSQPPLGKYNYRTPRGGPVHRRAAVRDGQVTGRLQAVAASLGSAPASAPIPSALAAGKSPGHPAPWQGFPDGWPAMRSLTPVLDWSLRSLGAESPLPAGRLLETERIRFGDMWHPVPWITQYASPSLIAAITYGGQPRAEDPRWRESGAPDRETYAAWCARWCGMACLRMALLARDGRRRPCTSWPSAAWSTARTPRSRVARKGSFTGLSPSTPGTGTGCKPT